MNPRRLAQGEKRARRVLRIWRASSTCFNRMVDAVQYADDGPQFRTMRYTRVPCSCLYCGNPRRHFGQVTRQERQAEDRMKEEIEDMQHELPLPFEQMVEYWYDMPWERKRA